jgi:hypothetical protein
MSATWTIWLFWAPSPSRCVAFEMRFASGWLPSADWKSNTAAKSTGPSGGCLSSVLHCFPNVFGSSRVAPNGTAENCVGSRDSCAEDTATKQHSRNAPSRLRRLQARPRAKDSDWRWSEDKERFGDMHRASNRVKRGGSWNNSARNVRTANRNRNRPSNTNNNLGFRVCLARSPMNKRVIGQRIFQYPVVAGSNRTGRSGAGTSCAAARAASGFRTERPAKVFFVCGEGMP